MIEKHVDKIHTFLILVEEKSFSKTSKKLNISQPAVTQKIRQLEEVLKITLVERKKNGILLTRDGKEFHNIAKEFFDSLKVFENKIFSLKGNKLPFLMGASFTVGNYILPKYLSYIKELLCKEIDLIVDNNTNLINSVIARKIDIAFVTKKEENENLIYQEWFDDKLVFFSNRELPTTIEVEDLKKYKFICREEESSIKKILKEKLENYDFSCSNLNVVSTVNNSTAVKNSVLNSNEQMVSVISINSIKADLQNKYLNLYTTKIKGIDLNRTIYIVYRKENKDNLTLRKFVKYLIELKDI